MVFVIIMAILAIIAMFICILKFPSIKIKGFTIDSFYLPILFVAILFLILPLFDKNGYFNVLTSNSSINPLKILVLFTCVSMLSIALDEAGFFKYIATIFIKKFNSSQYKLFIILYVLISVLTIFTSNDIVILTFTPFILYFSKRGKINPIPFLVMEFVAANTYSMLLSIGNPTNIYLASIFNISFFDYFIKMIIPTILVGVSSFIALILMFRKSLNKKIEVFDIENASISNKPLCIISAIHLFLTTILLAISSYINIEMWAICLSFACSLLLILIVYTIKTRKSKFLKSTIKRIPFSLIPFVLSMFTIIYTLDSYNVFKYIYDFFSSISNDKTEPILYLITSTLSCNIMNNIPMTLAYGSILEYTNNVNLIYATIIGSNIGAILTPVGALAGIMWLRILKINDVDYSFLKFMKNGLILTIVLIISGAIALLII
ncbi:MAG: hypothetical protein IJY14_04070 [Acholeplasmatales bacterium]|nr:hypothetical protein [Acholeplasmatales bacterium]